MADVFSADFESGLIDTSPLAQTVTALGTPPAAQSAAQAASGTYSLEIPGTLGAISVPAHASMVFNAGWTLEIWVYLSSLTSGFQYELAGQWDYGSAGTWAVIYTHHTTYPSIDLYVDPTDSGDDAGGSTGWELGLTAATWQHIIVRWDGAAFALTLDDVEYLPSYDVELAFPASPSTQQLTVGSLTSLGDLNASLGGGGYIDDVRVATDADPVGGGGGGEVDLDDELSDGIALLDGAGEPVGALHLGRGAGDLGVEQTDVALRLAMTTAADAVRVSPLPHAIKAAVLSLADTAGLASAAAALRAVLVRDNLRLVEITTPTGVFGLSALDGAQIAEQLFSATPVVLEDSVEAAELLAATATLRLVERLGIAPLLVPAARYGRTAVETLRLLDSLAQFFAGDVEDTIGTEDLPAGSVQAFATTVETLGIESEMASTLILRIVANDTIDIEPDHLERMIFAPVVEDAVEITAGYIAPDGGLTVWAMNSRSGAVTEYDDFAFNSFATNGDIYLGASAEGLFELTGDDSAGRDIIPRVKSGFFKFGDMRLSAIKTAYIGLRGDGDFVLKITTGHGQEYVYAAKPQNMRTTRVRMGKGLRASYFAFELVGDGADFDLDAIEFVPLVNKRRV